MSIKNVTVQIKFMKFSLHYLMNFLKVRKKSLKKLTPESLKLTPESLILTPESSKLTPESESDSSKPIHRSTN